MSEDVVMDELLVEFERRGEVLARIRELHGYGFFWCRHCDRVAPCPTMQAFGEECP